MAEAIITRRSKSIGKMNKIQQTIIIGYNQNWIVPPAVNNSFDIRIFGGGGGGCHHVGGGGGGWMNNKTIDLTSGTSIPKFFSSQ